MDRKNVKIYVKNPCGICYEPQRRSVEKISMRIDDIRRNLIQGNPVWEVLDSGEEIYLDMKNYNKDNSKKENDGEESEKEPDHEKDTESTKDEEKEDTLKKNENLDKIKNLKAALNSTIDEANNIKESEAYTKNKKSQTKQDFDKILADANKLNKTPDESLIGKESNIQSINDKLSSKIKELDLSYKEQEKESK